MQKINKFHHSITENGSLQVRLITEIQDDNGNTISKETSDPMSPAKIPLDDQGNVIPKIEKDALGNESIVLYDDVNGYDLTGWDARTRDIMQVIADPSNIELLQAEKQTITGSGLEEITSHDRTIQENGSISVRSITRIYENGKEISKKYHRSMISPGDDASTSDVMSKVTALKLHTAEVIEAAKPVPEVLTAEEAKTRAMAALDVEKKSKLNAGFLVDGVLFDSDINAEVRYTQLAIKFQSNSAYSTQWKAANDVWVTMNYTLFQLVLAAFEAHIAEVYAWLETEQEKL